MPTEGEISELHVGLKGTMIALYLKDLAAKQHWGFKGQEVSGKSSRGLRYGEAEVKATGGSGKRVRGERVVNEIEADTVRRVFGSSTPSPTRAPSRVALTIRASPALRANSGSIPPSAAMRSGEPGSSTTNSTSAG